MGRRFRAGRAEEIALHFSILGHFGDLDLH